MRYVGGKTRIAKWVAEHVLSVAGGRTRYVEPFVGSGANFVLHAPHFEEAIAGDAHLDLILMWQALAQGWQPPESVSREEYEALRKAPSSALRGFVGFGASFSGKWFGGYVDRAFDRHNGYWMPPFSQTARRALLKDAHVFAKASRIVHASYDQHEVDANTVVYCDPPYAGTHGYAGTGRFDHDAFWKQARAWAGAGALVLVSEENAPEDVPVLAAKPRKAMMRVAYGEENKMRSEVLFVLGSSRREEP